MSDNIKKSVDLPNRNLDEMDSDFLYHVGINIPDTQNTKEFQKIFGNVKVVCIGGTKARMEDLTKYLSSILGIAPDMDDGALKDYCNDKTRFAIFKVGPVLCCMHGIGMSSMGVILHELLKLLKYSKCIDPVFIRIGTCGGLGIQAGTVVVTDLAYTGYLKNEYKIPILGEEVSRPAKFNPEVNRALLACHDKNDGFDVIIGNTIAADCFYEGQGRLDGAICNYTKEKKLAFLQKCFEVHGIRNFEMEATMLSSMMLQANVRAADICVALLNRLEGDQVTITSEEKHRYESHPFIIVGRYIKKTIDNSA